MESNEEELEYQLEIGHMISIRMPELKDAIRPLRDLYENSLHEETQRGIKIILDRMYVKLAILTYFLHYSLWCRGVSKEKPVDKGFTRKDLEESMGTAFYISASDSKITEVNKLTAPKSVTLSWIAESLKCVKRNTRQDGNVLITLGHSAKNIYICVHEDQQMIMLMTSFVLFENVSIINVLNSLNKDAYIKYYLNDDGVLMARYSFAYDAGITQMQVVANVCKFDEVLKPALAGLGKHGYLDINANNEAQ